MKALRILSGIEISGGSVDLNHLAELRKLAIYKLKTMGGAACFKDLISSIEYLGGYSLHTLVIDDGSCEFIKSLDDLSYHPSQIISDFNFPRNTNITIHLDMIYIYMYLEKFAIFIFHYLFYTTKFLRCVIFCSWYIIICL